MLIIFKTCIPELLSHFEEKTTMTNSTGLRPWVRPRYLLEDSYFNTYPMFNVIPVQGQLDQNAAVTQIVNNIWWRKRKRVPQQLTPYSISNKKKEV